MPIKNLTLPMLSLLSSKAQGRKFFENHHVGIHWIALAEYSKRSTHLPGFQSFFSFFSNHFVLAKLATTSIRVKNLPMAQKSTECLCGPMGYQGANGDTSFGKIEYRFTYFYFRICTDIRKQVLPKSRWAQH